MRLGSLVTLGTGVAVGAGATYFLDPDHGPLRRREARRTAVRRAGRQGVDLSVRAARRAGSILEASVYGYHAGRQLRADEVARTTDRRADDRRR